MICPCKGCKNTGCGSYHDQCEQYQEYKKEMVKINTERKKARKYLRYYIKDQDFYKKKMA